MKTRRGVRHSTLERNADRGSKSIGWTAGALSLALILSSSAFFIPQDYLLALIVCDIVLVIHGVFRRGDFWVLGRVFLVQLAITLTLYYLIHGKNS